MAEARRLSPLDAAFLYFERGNQLLHVGGVAILEGPVPFDRFAESLEERLRPLRRYHQRAVRGVLDLSLPTWAWDPAFDVHRHVRRVAAPPPGGEVELHGLVDTLFATPFDPVHPLWEMYLIEGLEGGRAALLFKVHHAMLDGVSGAQVLDVITDPGPGVAPAPPPPPRRPNGATVTLPSWLRRGQDALAGVRSALSPGWLRARAGEAAEAAAILASFVSQPAPALPLNGRLSDARHIVWAQFPLDDFLIMRGTAACKVNDVVLAVITGALRRYLARRGVPTDGLALRALVPVSVRREDERLTLGNRVAAMFATLPVGIEDPLARLGRIAAETRALKERGQPRATELALMAAGALPAVVAPLFGRWLPERHLVNTVCTNVPGPREVRYLLGRRLLAIHPIVPIMFNIGAGFAILSYAGHISVAVNADARLVPDAAELARGLHESAAELHAALLAREPAAVAPAVGGTTLVTDLMTPEVLTVTPQDSLAQAWGLMRAHRIRHLPVVNGLRRLVGLLTHRDLLAAAASSFALPTERERVSLLGWHRVADVMETHVSTATPDEPAAEAGRRMVRHKIGCLPVIDAADHLVGIVTEEDFVRWATEHMAQAS